MEHDADTQSAAGRVFELPELLEQILCQLPHLKLLVVQRTSRLWRQVITTSPNIQKRLFMRPDNCLLGRYCTDKPGARPLNNLMLRKVIGGMYPTMTLRTNQFMTWDEFDAARGKASMADEDRAGRNAFDDERDPCGFWMWTVNISFPTDALMAAQEKNPAIAFPEASWRRMFVSQPPATALHLTRRWQRSTLPVIDVPEGITMQHLVMAADHKRSRWNEVYVGSDRDWHLEGPIKYSRFERREEMVSEKES